MICELSQPIKWKDGTPKKDLLAILYMLLLWNCTISQPLADRQFSAISRSFPNKIEQRKKNLAKHALKISYEVNKTISPCRKTILIIISQLRVAT